MASKSVADKVFAAGIVRDDERFLYYVDKRGDVVRMTRGVAKAPTVVLVKTGLKRERGYSYFVDADGDVAREPDRDS
jgi:hypothetical protein